MATLREVWVWPPSGHADRPWRADPDVDALAKVSRAVCDRYSEALPALGIQHWTSHIRMYALQPPEASAGRDNGQPWFDLRSLGARSGFEAIWIGVPSGFADWALQRQQRATLDLVHAAVCGLARARGLDRPERLRQAYRHVVDHDYGYQWAGRWRTAPGRGKPGGVPRLAARVHYALRPNGFGVARIEVAPADSLTDGDGSSAGSAQQASVRPEVSQEYATWTTSTSFRRADRTARWLGPDHFTVCPPSICSVRTTPCT